MANLKKKKYQGTTESLIATGPKLTDAERKAKFDLMQKRMLEAMKEGESFINTPDTLETNFIKDLPFTPKLPGPGEEGYKPLVVTKKKKGGVKKKKKTMGGVKDMYKAGGFLSPPPTYNLDED